MTTTSADGTPIEVELKYHVLDKTTGERLLAADEIGGFRARGPAFSVRVEDRYLDTPDGRIRTAGYAARLRRSDGRTTLAVKSVVEPAGAGGIHRRLELEGPADESLPVRRWPPSAARSLLIDICGDAPLAELVTIRQRRRKRMLDRDGTSLELSLDQVEAVHERRVMGRFIELEVEVTSGPEDGLQDVDAALATESGLAPAHVSKLDAALQAVAGTRGEGEASRRPQERPGASGDPAGAGRATAQPTRATKAAARTAPRTAGGPVAKPVAGAGKGPASDRPRLPGAKSPGVVAEDTVAEAGRKVLRFHLARMIAREPGTRAGSAPEELHAMRVATRRQRAAWRIFGDAFQAKRTKAFRARLREVASRLGAVRDLDVLLDGVEQYLAGLPDADRTGLEPMLAAWRQRRDEGRKLLLRELDSARYRRWLDAYVDFVGQEGKAVAVPDRATPHRVRDTTGSRIQAAFERVRAYEAILRDADIEALHELRIAAKWLRYSMEFVREALGPEVDELIQRVTALQDELGHMHDADVSARLAREFLADNARTLGDAETEAIGRFVVGAERERDRIVAAIGPPWRAVAGLTFRRRLGRVIAGL